MDLSRQEYPAMLDLLQPSQAVAILDHRVRHVGKLNNEIADWLEERRRIEEVYSQSLRKLARRQLPDGSSELGIFSSPWQRIVASAENLADSHHFLAQKIEADVEKPLRQFATSNREMQAMPNIQGNLASIAKDMTKSGKAKDTGARGGPNDAMSQWQSQAPYVFEQLQAADESRCNHLRDALTQFQTHEVDLVERNRVTAEQCLNALLNIETADEIKTFALRSTSGGGVRPVRPERTSSRGFSSGGPAPPTVASPPPEDVRSQTSESVHEDTKDDKKEGKRSGLKGFKRLGTVLSRRRQSTQPPVGSPSTKSRETHDTPSSSVRNREPSQAFHPAPIQESEHDYEPPEGPPPQRSAAAASSNGPVLSPVTTNGSRQGEMGRLQEPLQPQAPSNYAQPQTSSSYTQNQQPSSYSQSQEQSQADEITSLGPQEPSYRNAERSQTGKDPEGFNVPQKSMDPISQAQHEAESYDEPTPSQLKVDIQNQPIADESADDQTAMANVANALRAQATPARRGGTVRGRRDVRNTMFVSSSPTTEGVPGQQSYIPPLPQPSTKSPTINSTTSSLGTGSTSPTGFMMTPFLAQLGGGQTEQQEPTISTQSSFANATSSSFPASSFPTASATADTSASYSELNFSTIETISVWLEHGTITRATVIGELSLSSPSQTSFPSSSNSTETIRLDNFAALEKVAPNPSFITQSPGKPGEYTVNTSAIARNTSAVAFKYQMHIDPSTLVTQAPLILTPSWKVEPTQTSVILTYALNPAYPISTPLTLSNVVLIITLGASSSDPSDPSATTGKPTSCLSKPTGTFVRDRSLMYWRLDDLVLRPGAPAERVLARFATEGQASAGSVEARWEISGQQASGLGSGLGVSIAGAGAGGSGGAGQVDPFADEEGWATGGMGAADGKGWGLVAGERRLVSGTYVAV